MLISDTEVQESDLSHRPRGLYIGGHWQSPDDGMTITSINPSNGQKLGEVPRAGARDVDRAVKAARSAMNDWGRLPVTERAHCLERLAEEIARHRDELAMIDWVVSDSWWKFDLGVAPSPNGHSIMRRGQGKARLVRDRGSASHRRGAW